MVSEKNKSVLISPWVPVIALGLTAAGFLLSRPGTEAVVQQFVQIGEERKALELIRKKRADAGGDTNEDLDRMELAVVASLFPKTDASEQLGLWTAMLGRAVAEESGATRGLLEKLVLSAKDPVALGKKNRPQLFQARHARLVEALADRILSLGSAAPAAELLEAALAKNPKPSTADLMRLAVLHRQSGSDAKALEAVKRIPESSRTEATDTLRMELSRATGRDAEALALDAALLMKKPVVSFEELTVLAALSRAAGDYTAASPVFERHFAQHPGDVPSLRLYSDLMADGGRPAVAASALAAILKKTPGDRVGMKRLGMLYGWAGDTEGRGEVALELAILGEPGAVAALDDIEGVPRDLSLIGRLAEAVRAPGREADLVPVAAYLADLGEYASACRLYEMHLAKNPGDVRMAESYSLILEETGDPEAALPPLRRVVAAEPGNFALRDHFADLLLVTGRMEEALAQLGSLSRDHPTQEVLSRYARLAESLGHAKIAADALERLAGMNPEVTPIHYFHIAELRRDSGDKKGELAALTAALKKFPGDETLRYQLATVVADRLDYAGALAVIEKHSGLRTDPQVAALYLDLMRLAEVRSREAAYLSPEIPPVALSTPALRLRVSRALAAVGRRDESLGLLKALHEESPTDRVVLGEYLPALLAAGKRNESMAIVRDRLGASDAEALKLSAIVYAQAKDFRKSERLLKQLGAIPGQATEENLSMLGDTRLSSGNIQGAKQAYAAALRSLLDEHKKKGVRK